MTTWPGFGEGTFHDPDRYVREGREKDDPYPAGLLHFIQSRKYWPTSEIIDRESDIDDLLAEWPDDFFDLHPSDNTKPSEPCPGCGFHGIPCPCRTGWKPENHPAVARAMEILYPEET